MQFRDLQRQYEKLKDSIDKSIAEVLFSAHFISGEQVTALENTLADYVGVKHCITCGNGTDAISIALMAWGIGSGDAVFVPDFTFFSSGECPAAIGATPVFVDVKKETYNLDPEALEQEVKKVLTDGRYKPRAVIGVDLFGLPAEYEAIRRICDKYHLLLLEDGAQGFGGRIGEKRACSFGDISTTSFFPAKPLGCYGDGGAIFTDDDMLAERMRSIAVHGKNREDKYDNIRLGMNSRLDTLQAAVLQQKLQAFKDYELDDVNKAAELYTKCLSGVSGLILPTVTEGYYSSWAQYTIQLSQDIDRTAMQERLKAQGIPTMIYYTKPMHKQGAFQGTYSAEANCPVTEELCNRVLCLPIHPYLAEEEIEKVAEALKQGL
jgi:UDP-2-acetamido-2-deoxy-ribo-hexuluronate aminotransferase